MLAGSWIPLYAWNWLKEIKHINNIFKRIHKPIITSQMTTSHDVKIKAKISCWTCFCYTSLQWEYFVLISWDCWWKYWVSTWNFINFGKIIPSYCQAKLGSCQIIIWRLMLNPKLANARVSLSEGKHNPHTPWILWNIPPSKQMSPT